MTITVTPKSDAEINQLISLFNRSGYTQGDALSDKLKVGRTSIVFTGTKTWYAKTYDDLIEVSESLTVNELGTLLTRG